MKKILFSLVLAFPLLAGAHSATLDGGTATTTAPGATIQVVVTSNLAHNDSVKGINTGTDNLALTCVNVPDFTNHAAGHVATTSSFTITAPMATGTYPFYFQITGSNDCATLKGTVLSLTDAITVIAPVEATTTDATSTPPEETPVDTTIHNPNDPQPNQRGGHTHGGHRHCDVVGTPSCSVWVKTVNGVDYSFIQSQIDGLKAMILKLLGK